MSYKTLLEFKKTYSTTQIADMLSYTIPEYADMLYHGGEVTPKDKAKEAALRQLGNMLPNNEVNDPHEVYFIYDQTKHIGFVWFEKRLMTHELFLQYVGVFPEYRRRGYAQKALSFVDIMANHYKAKLCNLTVLKHNRAAVGLYKNNGYMIQPEYFMPQRRTNTRHRMYKSV